jgi:hypothetical protein
VSTDLRRYKEPVTSGRLPGVILEPWGEPSEAVGFTAEFDEVRELVSKISFVENPTPLERTAWDREIVRPLHQALSGIPRRVALDMRLWHWLCAAQFPNFVWMRWLGGVPDHATRALTPSISERFLGGQSLHGVSRNALARLYWCAEILHSERDGYHLAYVILSSQDFFQAVFEREFSLYPPAARACVRELASASEDERREATRKLNHYLTTIVVETLREDEIRALIRR